ncbi:hypothetical protein GCM10009128_24780 [Psychrosphaera haliotis]|uniref:lanthionine synthetase C family protein n=1 Tax=Psychrosphaera haliotis TaxID=555083 RepID=UPI0031D874AA
MNAQSPSKLRPKTLETKKFSSLLEEMLFDVVGELKNISSENEKLSLVGGHLSSILFFFNFNRFYPDYDLERLIEEQITRAFEKASNAELNSSLADGISGLGWLLDHIGLNKLEDNNEDIDECLLALLSQSKWKGDYDLLYGLVGIGVYAVQRVHTTNGRKICEMVFNLLKGLAVITEDFAYWETSRESIFFRTDISAPQVDLGLAHGVSGVLGLLIKLHKNNIFPAQCKSLINKVSNYIQLQIRDSVIGSSLPSHSSDERNSLLGWCYGDLSTSLLLIKAGNEIQNRELFQIGETLALKTLNRNKITENLEETSLCHGYSGIALIYKRLYQETSRVEFLESSHYWMDELLQRYEIKKNLVELMPQHKVTSEHFNGAGLLIGYAGIGLAILSFIHPAAYGWDECILLS